MFTLAQELRAAANDHFSVIVETVKKKWKRMATSQKQQPRTKELLGFWLENYINNNQLL